MNESNFNSYNIYYSFLNKLAKEMTSFYYKKLDRPFKVINKSKKKGYDPVTKADMALERFISSAFLCEEVRFSFLPLKLCLISNINR